MHVQSDKKEGRKERKRKERKENKNKRKEKEATTTKRVFTNGEKKRKANQESKQ